MGGGGGGIRPNTATSRSFAFAFASTTLSIPFFSSLPADFDLYSLQEAEVAKLTALLQKTEMKAKSLELTVDQKVKENEVGQREICV